MRCIRTNGSAGLGRVRPPAAAGGQVAGVHRRSQPRRYRLLESLRAYAAQRLAASGVEPEARRAHAHHYLELAEHAAGQLRTSQQRAAIDRLTTEQPNLRAGAGAQRRDRRYRGQLAVGRRTAAVLGRHRATTRGIGPGSSGHWRSVTRRPRPRTVAGLAAASAILQASDARASFDLARRAERLAAGLDDLSRALAARARRDGRDVGPAGAGACPRCTTRWTGSAPITLGSVR